MIFRVEFDSDLKSNAAIVERAKIIAKDVMNNPSSIENKFKQPNQEEYSYVMKTEKRKSNYKWINKKHNEIKPSKSFEKSNPSSANINKNQTKIKLNFLQESQLTSEQLADTCKNNSSNTSKSLSVSVDCVTNMMLHKQINGLNPSALEFTPSVEKKSAEKVDKYSTETIESNLKILNINGDTSQQQHQPISNPVVLDDGLINQPFNFSFYDPHFHPAGKITASNDSTMLQNMFQYPTMPVARPISRINYNPTQTIVPQFQVVPQLIRYNQSQNLPVNYLVYSPVMFNGMYNPIVSNRIFPIGPTDIPPAGNLTTQFAHPFNHNTNNNSINNNHIISVPNSQPYFTDSMNNNSHIR